MRIEPHKKKDVSRITICFTFWSSKEYPTIDNKFLVWLPKDSGQLQEYYKAFDGIIEKKINKHMYIYFVLNVRGKDNFLPFGSEQ